MLYDFTHTHSDSFTYTTIKLITQFILCIFIGLYQFFCTKNTSHKYKHWNRFFFVCDLFYIMLHLRLKPTQPELILLHGNVNGMKRKEMKIIQHWVVCYWSLIEIACSLFAVYVDAAAATIVVAVDLSIK